MADLIAAIPEQLDKFETVIVKPFLAREDAVKNLLPAYRVFLQAIAEGDNEKSKRLSEELRSNSRFVMEIRGHFSSDLWYRLGKRVAEPLFWAIIQQIAMPPKIRTVVEGASRFWSKTRIVVRLKAKRKYGDEADFEYCEAYLKLCDELRKHVTAAQAAVSNGQLHGAPETKTKLQVGSFTLVNTGGFSDEMMAGVAEVVEKAEHAMRGVGLGKVCYGDILVTKTIAAKATVAAFYVLKSDEMFVRANVKAHWDTVQTVCHELAHRLENKFLKGKQGEINVLYRTIGMTDRFKPDYPIELYPMAGDTIIDPKYGELQVVRPDYVKQSIKMLSEKMPGVTLSLPLASWLKAKNIRVEAPEGQLQWVTDYARKNSNENFAEMVSYYALGKLPKNQVPMLEAIL